MLEIRSRATRTEHFYLVDKVGEYLWQVKCGTGKKFHFHFLVSLSLSLLVPRQETVHDSKKHVKSVKVKSVTVKKEGL